MFRIAKRHQIKALCLVLANTRSCEMTTIVFLFPNHYSVGSIPKIQKEMSQTMSLDPQAEEFLAKLATMNVPPIYTLTPDQARATVYRIPPPYDPIAQTWDHEVANSHGVVPVRIYVPGTTVTQTDAPLPILVFYHGGGWMLGQLDDYDHLCRRLANQFKAVVVSVGYRLSPEFRFPVGLNDCYSATVWASEHAREFGADPHKLVVLGDSAGGNLAAAVCLMARDRGGPSIAFQLLIYPVTDHDFQTKSYLENATGFMLTREAMMWFWRAYLPEQQSQIDPLAAPLRANLENLPPGHVITAEFDPLRDEGESYAIRLKAAGNNVSHKRYNGMIHGFVRRIDLFDQASLAIQEMAAVVNQALNGL